MTFFVSAKKIVLTPSGRAGNIGPAPSPLGDSSQATLPSSRRENRERQGSLAQLEVMALKKSFLSQSAFFNPRILIGFVLCSIGLLLALVGFSKYVTDLMENPVSKTGTVRSAATTQAPWIELAQLVAHRALGSCSSLSTTQRPIG